jgi:hypothetical protein
MLMFACMPKSQEEKRKEKRTHTHTSPKIMPNNGGDSTVTTLDNPSQYVVKKIVVHITGSCTHTKKDNKFSPVELT